MTPARATSTRELRRAHSLCSLARRSRKEVLLTSPRQFPKAPIGAFRTLTHYPGHLPDREAQISNYECATRSDTDRIEKNRR